MDVSLEYLKDAFLNVKSAEHILAKTYKITKNERLLLTATLKIYESIISISNALLIDDESKELELSDYEKIELLKNSSFLKEEELKKFIDEVVIIAKKHDDSPVEFTRNNEFVICGNNYDLRKISVSGVQRFISYANILIERVNGKVTDNG